MRIEPYKCICLRPGCHYEWETRDLGEGHEEPKRCANVKCRSPYWNNVPKEWLAPDFKPENINTGDKRRDARLIKRCILERKKRGLVVSV